MCHIEMPIMCNTLGGQRPGFSTERLEELREFQTMLKTYPNYGDGVRYLRGLEHAAAGPVPCIDFVHATMMARHRARPLLREPVPGLEGHQLRVVYKRHRPHIAD